MLKKPLVSSGTIYVRGAAMFWDIKEPEPTALQITATEVRLYYPQQKTIEVYQIQQKLAQIAASPLPRLSDLLQHFAFEPLAISDLGATDAAKYLAVKMTPIAPELREHVEQIRVLLDATTGLIDKLEMTDPDGDRTLIKFSNAKLNVGLHDAQLQIQAPTDVKITRPLQAIEGQSNQERQH
jgi:outer membrane lipoprotein-sorting protein